MQDQSQNEYCLAVHLKNEFCNEKYIDIRQYRFELKEYRKEKRERNINIYR